MPYFSADAAGDQPPFLAKHKRAAAHELNAREVQAGAVVNVDGGGKQKLRREPSKRARSVGRGRLDQSQTGRRFCGFLCTVPIRLTRDCAGRLFPPVVQTWRNASHVHVS